VSYILTFSAGPPSVTRRGRTAHIDVSADAKALNTSGFRGALRIAQLSQRAAPQPPQFVVEPRKWGQTRFQYFLTLWVLSGVVFGMLVVACWMCLLLHLSAS
jgi:hypothetical protein